MHTSPTHLLLHLVPSEPAHLSLTAVLEGGRLEAWLHLQVSPLACLLGPELPCKMRSNAMPCPLSQRCSMHVPVAVTILPIAYVPAWCFVTLYIITVMCTRGCRVYHHVQKVCSRVGAEYCSHVCTCCRMFSCRCCCRALHTLLRTLGNQLCQSHSLTWHSQALHMEATSMC